MLVGNSVLKNNRYWKIDAALRFDIRFDEIHCNIILLLPKLKIISTLLWTMIVLVYKINLPRELDLNAF